MILSRAKYIKDSGVKCDWIVMYDVDYVSSRSDLLDGKSCV